jgi:phosphatidylinositol glycan class V
MEVGKRLSGPTLPKYLRMRPMTPNHQQPHFTLFFPPPQNDTSAPNINMAFINHESRPLGSLSLLFTGWKAFLLAITLGASVGLDYDTSTSLFFDRVYGQHAAVPALAQRLTRWDALYFVHAARFGKVYEQEWAFSISHSGLVSALTGLVPTNLLGVDDGATVLEPLVGIAVANLSHLLSVLALYQLTALVSSDRRFAFVASILHIISPAGLFLSAPYAESPFSCLSFLGTWLFALSYKHRHSTVKRGVSLVASGALFGLSSLFRSNGLASGLLFAVEAVRCLISFAQKPGLSSLLSLLFPVAGGLYIAGGFAAPQVIAWMRYCDGAALRPWCARTVPSIYSFVQEHYW